MKTARVPRNGSISLSCIALILALVLPGLVLGAVPKGKGWVELQAGNFTIHSQTTPRQTRKIAMELVRFQEVLARITKGYDFSADKPMTIVVFKNDVQLTPYKRDGEGDTKNVAGYFMERPFRNYVALDASAESTPMRLVYHEYVHSLLHKTFDSIPVWLDEGLAEYYSTFRFMTTSNSAQVGHPIESHLYYLDRHGLLPVSELFSTTRESSTYNEGERQGSFYAQSWLVVHYFMVNEERRKRLGRYLTALRDDAGSEEALTAVLGMSEEELTRELKQYLQTGSNFYWVDFDEATETLVVETREMSPGEVLCSLGSLLAQRTASDAGAAVAHLNAALEQGGPKAQSHSMLGLTHENSDDVAAAAVNYGKSVEAEGADSETFARYGGFLLQRFNEEHPMFDIQAAAPETVLEARKQFRRSLELDPDQLEALAGLGRSFLVGNGDLSEGLQALAKANSLRPDRVDILHDMACILAKSGRSNAAWSVIKTQLTPKVEDASIVQSAEGWVVATEFAAAYERVKDGDPSGAAEILEQALSRATDPELQRSLEEALQRLDGAMGDGSTAPIVTAEMRDDPFIQKFERAMDLANSGQIDEALQVLSEMLETCGAEEICESIRQAADSLRQVAEREQLIGRYNEAIGLINDGRRKAAVEILRELEKASDEEVRQRARQILDELGVR